MNLFMFFFILLLIDIKVLSFQNYKFLSVRQKNSIQKRVIKASLIEKTNNNFIDIVTNFFTYNKGSINIKENIIESDIVIIGAGISGLYMNNYLSTINYYL